MRSESPWSDQTPLWTTLSCMRHWETFQHQVQCEVGAGRDPVAAFVPLGALTPPPSPAVLPQGQKRKQSPFSVWSYMKLNASHRLSNRLARCHSSPNPSVHSLAINARCEKYSRLPGNKISICLTVNPAQVLLSERKLMEVSHLKD